MKLGGSSESVRKLVAGLNGSVGAIHGASSAASEEDERHDPGGDRDLRREEAGEKIVVLEARR